MGTPTAYDVFAMLTVALGASWCAGINLYATVFVLGVLHRWAPGFQLPGTLDVLGSHWVLWPALTMYTGEFIADKFPAFDTIWDGIHTFIRPLAGAVLAAMALGSVPLELQVCAALVGGFVAFGSHATKATIRLAAHASGTSPVVSPVASLAEDAAVVTTLAFLAAYPVITLILVVLMMVGAFVVLRMFWRLTQKAFAWMRGGHPPPLQAEGRSR